MRRQWWALVVVAAGVITLTAACGSESEADPTPAASSAAESEDLATASVQRELSVEMRDIAFEPLALTGAAGEVIEIRFQNAGAILHDFTIDEMDADVMEMMGGSGVGVDMHMGDDHDAAARAMHLALDAGQEGRMRLRVHEPGTYSYYCTVPGHREAGMMGTLTIQ
ncbi:MAG: multicopper oxidase domain-containing protein [Dehalococcoidia bacterium]|nr:multicopper oxidase domain-containing protein [Dehalococcoidia bacterium]MCA9850844.1 multicopper oxidase domain-containing protein [Dehalococcoidia bacterium]